MGGIGERRIRLLALRGRRVLPAGYTEALPDEKAATAIAFIPGAFVNPEPRYLQSTGFVLGPDDKVIVSVYSSGAIGRLVSEDVAGLVRYVRDHAAA